METVHFVDQADIAENIQSLFKSEREILRKLFPDAQIEHIGGTAVPGLLTKGDLDINIRVNGPQFAEIVELLKNHYEINQIENWTSNYASFKDDVRNIGVQLTILGSKEDYFVAQRDYLLSHPEAISQLNELKHRYEGGNMGEYRKSKGIFFENLDLDHA